MRNIVLTISYDGTGYNGWQVQKSGITIQAVIEDALRKITKEAVRLTGAGRTDSGVHALGQVASFWTSAKLTPDVFKRALNSVLPNAIVVCDAREASGDFHARYDAIWKRYFYLIRVGSTLAPIPLRAFLHRYMWEVKYNLDIEKIRRAATDIIGEHDFASFCNAGSDVKTTVRVLHEANVATLQALNFLDLNVSGEFIKLSFAANGFLRGMVRNIVGTLVDIGRGKIHVDDMKSILRSHNRGMAGESAPAKGLFLECIRYESQWS